MSTAPVEGASCHGTAAVAASHLACPPGKLGRDGTRSCRRSHDRYREVAARRRRAINAGPDSKVEHRRGAQVESRGSRAEECVQPAARARSRLGDAAFSTTLHETA